MLHPNIRLLAAELRVLAGKACRLSIIKNQKGWKGHFVHWHNKRKPSAKKKNTPRRAGEGGEGTSVGTTEGGEDANS